MEGPCHATGVPPIDRIEYDVTAQMTALQDGVCERVWGCVCVRECVVEIKPGTLRAACFFDGLTYKMVTFKAAKWLFNTVYTASVDSGPARGQCIHHCTNRK